MIVTATQRRGILRLRHRATGRAVEVITARGGTYVIGAAGAVDSVHPTRRDAIERAEYLLSGGR